jgi:DNA primase
MALSTHFLDELRSRTTLSSLIKRSVKLKKAGNEYKGCCPFHSEKTPSFTVNDDKGFYHCFGCGAHGDAIRWLTDHDGLPFMDAVHQLAAAAGVEVPKRSAAEAERETVREERATILDRATAWFAEQLAGDAKVLAELADRGLSAEAIAKFGLGFAPAKRTVSASGIPPEALEAAGLLIRDDTTGLWRDRFNRRIMIPIHDHRGRTIGYSGRIFGSGDPKYLNSPESAAFTKGDVLFNLHRAAQAARSARRLLIVEGQFDAIALDSAGIGEVTAPMGTALTERQLERAWRTAECPILLFDGDPAGRKAAMRACERALPHVGPGRSLRIAVLPEGEDPDSLVRSGGREAIEAVLAAAGPPSAWLWESELAAADETSPEGRAALWARLQALATSVRDEETRAQYLSEWRARFDERYPPAPPGLTENDIVPDGRVADLSDLKEGERVRLRRVALAQMKRAMSWATATPKKAGRQAWEIGRRVSSGLIDEDEAEPLLVALREAVRFDAAGDPINIDKSYDYGKRRTFDVAAMVLDMRCAELSRTDKGNAERWYRRFGEDYLYTTAKGWLGWDGRRYRVLNQEKDVTPAEVLASVFECVEAIRRESDFVRDTGWPEWEELSAKLLVEMGEDPRQHLGMDRMVHEGNKPARLSRKLAAWALSSESSGRIGCIANLAKRWVTVELTDFDTDTMLLNCMNGTLRFYPPDDDRPARVEMHPHDRADRLTKVTACNYDPEADAPNFQALVKWAQPDRARRRYLRQWLGYNLTGEIGAQIFHIWYGPLAANGKSTVGNACRDAMGDYGDAGKVETFLTAAADKGGDAATPALVRLPGVRMLTAGEPKSGVAINEALINSLTGGDQLLVRDNFRSFFRFLPTFKFTLWCNELPPIPRGTAGIWRRVKVMPWEQHLEEKDRDPDFPKKLAGEFAGILSWMVRGLIDWMDNGFVEPESVQHASLDYKQDSDPLSIFLRTCTAPDPEGRVQSSHLYELFTAWARAAGEVEWKQKGFSQALKAKGLVSKASNGIHWQGLRMTKSASDFVDHEGRVRSDLSESETQGMMGPDGGAPPRPPPDDDDFVPGFD